RLPHSFFSASAAHSAHTPSRIALPPTTVAIAPCHRRPPCPACSGIHASSVRRPTPPNPRRHFPRRHRLRPTLQLPRDAAAFSLSFVVHPITAIPRLLAAVAAPTPHTPTPVSSTPPQRIANGAVLSLLPRDDGGAAADRKAPDVKDAASRSACSAIARSARPVSW
ncbi:Os02g0466600, partial [Oryza sativa Japonica Group]